MPKLYYKDPSTGEYVEYTPVAKIPQEWKDKVDEKVDDVQINGTSVVQDGVANIPHAKIGTFGLINIGYSNNGLQLDSSGYLKTARASKAEVDAKTDVMKPITPDVLDRGVRAGLISNAEITDADKPLICQTIGAEPKKGEWVLKGTLTEERDISVDMSGCSEIIVVGKVDSCSAVQNITFNYNQSIYAAFDTNKKYVYAYFRDSMIGLDCIFAKSSDNSNPSRISAETYGFTFVDGTKTSSIYKFGLQFVGRVTGIDIKLYAR